LQIVVLRQVALSPSYVWKTQIVITNEIATEFFRLSVQPQLSKLEPCTVHTLWNTGKLIKRNTRELKLWAKRRTHTVN